MYVRVSVCACACVWVVGWMCTHTNLYVGAYIAMHAYDAGTLCVCVCVAGWVDVCVYMTITNN